LRESFDLIKSEFDSTVAEILAITQSSDLLGSNPTLQRTLGVRDTYLLPLHTLQVTLLDRVRKDRAAGIEPDPALIHALSVTINGIATGLRNTG
jgi:phosphoenolpyruvate carboxylase